MCKPLARPVALLKIVTSTHLLKPKINLKSPDLPTYNGPWKSIKGNLPLTRGHQLKIVVIWTIENQEVLSPIGERPPWFFHMTSIWISAVALKLKAVKSSLYYKSYCDKKNLRGFVKFSLKSFSSKSERIFLITETFIK